MGTRNNQALYYGSFERFATEDERYESWPVFGYYEVRGRGKQLCAVATKTVPEDVRPKKGPKSFNYGSRNFGQKRFRRHNVEESYMPLAEEEYADLFAKFARLGDKGEVSQEDWENWLHTYGVLGIRESLPGGIPLGQRNEEIDIFSRFAEEAVLANRTLRLFEAIIAPDNLDTTIILELLPEEYSERSSHTDEELESAALWTVQTTVERKTHAACYQRLVPRDSASYRNEGTKPFAREWGFDSLLGAMWMQFMWFASDDGIRRCKSPACRDILPSYLRSDAQTCRTEKCKKAYQRFLKRNRRI